MRCDIRAWLCRAVALLEARLGGIFFKVSSESGAALEGKRRKLERSYFLIVLSSRTRTLPYQGSGTVNSFDLFHDVVVVVLLVPRSLLVLSSQYIV